jgi:hypothetical protein
MPDDKTKRGPQDRNRIDIHEPYELEYWSKTLGVSKDELRETVERVGPSVNAVAQELETGRRKAS